MKYFHRLLILCCIGISSLIFACSFPDDEVPYTPPVELVDILVDNLNFEGQKAFVSNDPIRKEAYMIGVTYMVRDSMSEGNSSNPREHKQYDRFINNFDLRVISNTDFDQAHPAGSDITDMFTMKYLSSNFQDIHQFCFVLIEEPLIGEHSFTVRAIFEDGDLDPIEATTNPVTLY